VPVSKARAPRQRKRVRRRRRTRIGSCRPCVALPASIEAARTEHPHSRRAPQAAGAPGARPARPLLGLQSAILRATRSPRFVDRGSPAPLASPLGLPR
jgi:hypothetical protein